MILVRLVRSEGKSFDLAIQARRDDSWVNPLLRQRRWYFAEIGHGYATGDGAPAVSRRVPGIGLVRIGRPMTEAAPEQQIRRYLEEQGGQERCGG